MGSVEIMKLLLDTHIWIWLILGSNELTQKHRELLSNPDGEVWLSPVSVWEAILLAEKRRIEVDSQPIEWVRQALTRFPVREAGLNNEVAIQSRRLGFSNQDPADRFIAATAVVYDLHLVTMDEKLRVSPIKFV